jgi:hypothetical protein
MTRVAIYARVDRFGDYVLDMSMPPAPPPFTPP